MKRDHSPVNGTDKAHSYGGHSLRDVTKAYGWAEALRDVSLDLQEREVVGLLGLNGAGKTTLFQIASGLFAPDAGTVELLGTDYRRDAAMIHAQLGVVFQGRSLDSDLTVRGNLEFLAACTDRPGVPWLSGLAWWPR